MYYCFMNAFKAYDLNHWQDFLRHGLDSLLNLHNSAKDKKVPVLKPADVAHLTKEFQHLGGTYPKIELSEILHYSNILMHPGYMGHQVVPPTLVSVLAGLISNYLNQGMAVSDMGQSATAVERAVIKRMLKHYGWEDGEGIMTSGGSLGNLTALLAARQSVSNMWEEGVDANYCILVSADAHYCVDRAARIMGMGAKGVVKIAPNKNHKIGAAELNAALKEVASSGKKVLAVVGSACSTGPGVFDELEAIGTICNERKIWFHVDAAHGGMLQLSAKYKSLLKGVELADSVVIDFHKMGFTPAITTAVLFRDEKSSYKTFSQDASYLWSDMDFEPWTQSGLRTIECTKLMMGLKAYANLFWLGEEELVAMMDHLMDTTKEFAKIVADKKEWELLHMPEANILCFRHVSANDDQQLKALKEVIKKGRHYIVSTKLNGKFYFRLSIMNVYTDLAVFNELLKKLEEQL